MVKRVFDVRLIRTVNGITAQIGWDDVDLIDRQGQPQLTLNFPEEELRRLLDVTTETRTLQEMVEEFERETKRASERAPERASSDL